MVGSACKVSLGEKRLLEKAQRERKYSRRITEPSDPYFVLLLLLLSLLPCFVRTVDIYEVTHTVKIFGATFDALFFGPS